MYLIDGDLDEARYKNSIDAIGRGTYNSRIIPIRDGIGRKISSNFNK